MYIRSNRISELSEKQNRDALSLISALCYVGLNTVEYSTNKISKVLHCSHNTIKKRLNYCITNNLVEIDGKFIKCKSLKSRHKEHNFEFGTEIKIITLKNFDKALYFFHISNPIRQKEHRKLVCEVRENVKDTKTFKKIETERKRLGYGTTYNEYGISYDTISKKSSCCKKTAQKYINYGIANKLLTKQNHKKTVIVANVCDHDVFLGDCFGMCTYGYQNKMRTVLVWQQANTYILA